HAVDARVLAAAAVDELGDVLTGRRPGRSGGELIVCDLTGVGAQDAAIAEHAWRCAGAAARSAPDETS
ncbi:MAG TPA: hypothetical protein VJ957_01705, partial [Longimicrobiales bacterium]|nr:hypothetical protein [Longimicrobiales bacterium]